MGVKKLDHDYILARLEELPTLPAVVYELNQVISDPMSSTAEIEKIMEHDQSITTKVLKLANSSYYAIPGGVSSLRRAIAYIGYNTVHQLVLSTSIIQALGVKGPFEFDFNAFWRHSTGVAIAAECLAELTGHPMPSDIFTGGLIHDMGKVALFTVDRETLMTISKHAGSNNISFYEAEKELEVIPHTQIGKILAEMWQLPLQMQSIIQYHHRKDPRARGGISGELSRNVDIVFLANLLVHALKFGNSGHNKILGAPKEVLERLTIDPGEEFKTVLKTVKKNLVNASDFIRLLEASNGS